MHSLKKRQRKATLTALLFILPFFILFTIFTIYPIVQGVWVSLSKWSLMGFQKYVGLENFEKLFEDSKFWASLKHTTTFVIMCVPLVVILSLVLALFANRPVKYKKFLRVSYYLPGVLSVSVASFVAKYTFAPYRGLVNGILKWMGLCDTNSEPLWFMSINLSWIVIVLMTAWWTLGFPMLLYLAALQDISTDIMEAADVDGASSSQKLFHITLPLLKPTIFLVTLLQIIASFKVFGQIRLITGGGPASATKPLIQYIYEQAFDKNKLGYAAAMSYILFLILVVCTVVQLRFQKGDEDR